MPTKELYLPDLIGQGYGDFWRFRGRYRVLKGSRAAKKSKNTALWYIIHLMLEPQANLLVVRKVFRTLKDSCYAELCWAIRRLGVESSWECKLSPLEICYLPTGQKIYFRGLDDPLKITSITVEQGVLCWLWLEEAYEVASEQDFNILDESIRGATPPGLFKQLTLTFNPWNERHWLKRRFFDAPANPEILAKTVNYLANEWLDAADRALFQAMQKLNPRRYQVAGLGNWGIQEGLIYENWQEAPLDLALLKTRPGLKSLFGLDFGYSNDPTALVGALADCASKEIFIFDEIYQKGLTNAQIYAAIAARGYAKELIRADAAEPKSIAELRELGLRRIVAARKGPDSVRNGIQFLQNFKLWIDPSCQHFIQEIASYAWADDAWGGKLNLPHTADDHLLDALRYAAEGLQLGQMFSFR